MAVLGLLLVAALAPLAFAASDCEHTCCDKYNGNWDDDFDDCKGAATGFDGCVSDCEAAVYAARPQGPGPASPENTYTCKVGFILLSLGAAAALMARKT